MHGRLAPLTGDRLAELPEDCRTCLFWELGSARPQDRGPDRSDVTDDRVAVQKQAWVTAETLEAGAPGRAVTDGGQVVGFVVFAASTAFAARRTPTAPVASPDALLLATAWVDPTRRGRGIGRQLVQAAVKEALARDLPAVEAYGDRRWREAGCVLPSSWLLHEGFEVAVQHPRHPLLRLETSRTVRWADAFGHAVDEVMDRLPRRVPATAPDAIESGSPGART